jgi:hypothetical protein
MGTEALVALVLSVTQVAKSWLQNWFKQLEWKAWMSVVLSLLVTAGVVLYDALKNGIPINLDLIWIMVTVFALANGAKKLLGTIGNTPKPPA